MGIEVCQAGAKGGGRQGGPRFPIDDRCQCPQEIDDRCQSHQDALATPAHSATEKAQASHLIATLIEYQSSCTTEQLVAQGSCRDIAGVPASFLGLANCVAVPTSAELPSRPSCQGARSGKTQTRNTHTQHKTHTQHSHTENDTHTHRHPENDTHTQTPQARFWTQTLRKGPSGVRRARRTNTPQARLWTQTLRQGPSGVRRGRRVRRSKAHLRLAKPVERQHRE